MATPDELARMQEIQRLIRQKQIAEGVRRMIALLNQARRDIVADVMETDWERFYLPRLRTAIERHLNHWQDLALQRLTGDQAASWTLAQQDMQQLFRDLAVDVHLPELPTSLLQTLQTKAARHIGHLMNFAKDQIDRTIALALLTGESREDTIAKLGRHLEYGTPFGPPAGKFGTIAARARFIYEHEVAGAYAEAKHRRFAQSARYAPGLKKVWVHQGHPRVPRLDHIAMHGQQRGPDEDFRNPMTGAELAFPRDLSADIGETAGCTCDFMGWRDEFGTLADFIGPATTAARRAA